MINLLLGLFCIAALLDSWKRNMFVWTVIWAGLLVYDIYVWTLL